MTIELSRFVAEIDNEEPGTATAVACPRCGWNGTADACQRIGVPDKAKWHPYCRVCCGPCCEVLSQPAPTPEG